MFSSTKIKKLYLGGYIKLLDIIGYYLKMHVRELILRMHKGFSTILRIFFYKNKNTQKTYIKPLSFYDTAIIRKLNKFSFH